MVNIVGPSMSHADETRQLIRSLYATEADIQPDQEKEALTVRRTQRNENYFPGHEYAPGLQIDIMTNSFLITYKAQPFF